MLLKSQKITEYTAQLHAIHYSIIIYLHRRKGKVVLFLHLSTSLNVGVLSTIFIWWHHG